MQPGFVNESQCVFVCVRSRVALLRESFNTDDKSERGTGWLFLKVEKKDDNKRYYPMNKNHSITDLSRVI